MKIIGFIFMILFSLSFFAQKSAAEFEMHTPIVKAAITQGNEIYQEISFFNGDKTADFFIAKINGGGFYEIEDSEFAVESNSYGSFRVKLGNNELMPGVYTDEVSISSDKATKKIPVVLEVESKGDVVFDSTVEVLKRSSIYAGGDFFANVKVHNLGSTYDSVSVTYSIKDLAGNIIYEEVEVLNVREPVQIGKSTFLPIDIAVGTYIFSVIARQGQSYACATETFSIVDNPSLSPSAAEKDYSKLIGFFVILFLIASVILLSYYWNKRVFSEAKDWRGKIDELKKTKFSDTAKAISKLKYQKTILQKAYARHYITKQSYLSGTDEINALIERLKKRL